MEEALEVNGNQISMESTDSVKYVLFLLCKAGRCQHHQDIKIQSKKDNSI